MRARTQPLLSACRVMQTCCGHCELFRVYTAKTRSRLSPPLKVVHSLVEAVAHSTPAWSCGEQMQSAQGDVNEIRTLALSIERPWRSWVQRVVSETLKSPSPRSLTIEPELRCARSAVPRRDKHLRYILTVSVPRYLVESEARFHRVGSDEKFVGSETADDAIVPFDVSAVLPEQVVGKPNKLRDGFPVDRRPASRASSNQPSRSLDQPGRGLTRDVLCRPHFRLPP